MVGDSVSHYRVLNILGRGGMGVVYKAQDLNLGRFAALKFLPDELAGDPRTRSRFQREARAASALNHPYICTIYEVGEDAGQAFIAMEYLEGVPLKQILESGRLELDRRPGRSVPVADGVVHWQNRLLAVERLADDAGEEPGRRLVGQTRADANRR